ncbi:tRNA (adenosine(37)-N6)-threonylcarbamoyltransferase complex dimerization subunit type 1 TsaB [Alcaligenes endophyticus]|uniref:tRNA (Adenosine(37)-N6)-threonylcarbamoyltransferase complex dimerization subunit type 1 TsaB n=1 Tax=Alcaligenes endophyticus TaxID=1929088 RepID=A0ABT8EHL9_9BURK|nr:tRNA (adenosine(37)-N6)-threonylcarbamoyltransferase complex dimerization subunit type 1 TsaB [Alcaligenes endophyticus]MCX5592133.1 tRNA (adenosine(37)-N6)-threonylcarbamoyltransferase complex dimerization subunit type 1 TsaB [Alcaligenes endophyticus]MDN4120780.1 tRNA (adenosine(37)-N6)-threonylcarbamoyltransferase complex dimerization subunit type 1 TsaB [Alcaligenes endophyticus]
MMDAHILAIETSSSLCGLALLSRTASGVQLRTLEHDGTGDHAERLLPMAQALLDQAGLTPQDLSAIAFGQGPGGFTGLRVACGIAQGMAYALNIPVLPVSTLLAAAWCDVQSLSLSPGHTQLVIQDARMNEVYAGAYRLLADSSWQTLLAPVLIDVEQVPDWLEHRQKNGWGQAADVLRVSGDALSAFKDLSSTLQGMPTIQCGTPSKASATAVAYLALADWDNGKSLPAAQAMPLYVRDKVAFTIQEREQGRGGNPAALDQAMRVLPMAPQHVTQAWELECRVQQTPWSQQSFMDALQSGYHALVIEQQGKLQGFAIYLAAPDVLQLLLIAVQPDLQGQGLGRLLLEQGERYAQQQGLASIFLEVRVSNSMAQEFYLHCGYEVIGRRKNYYLTAAGQREDALLMQKNIHHNKEQLC